MAAPYLVPTGLHVTRHFVYWIGGFYEKMRPAEFWAMHAVIAAGGGLLVVLFGRRLSRALNASPVGPLAS